MAVADPSRQATLRLAGFRLNAANAPSLAAFYQDALGFRELSLEHLSGARMESIAATAGRALRIELALGEQRIELLQFVDTPGRPYPAQTQSSDLVFQHFAIVVADMDAAMDRLSAVAGWSPITRDGPQRLPESSGGVTAFKFRDPEGHPLELLAFPEGNTPAAWRSVTGDSPFLGIDHSAISVSDTSRSVAWYQTLGLAVSNRSVNDDPAQARLDHLDEPAVEVTAMSTAAAPPHAELLCYRHRRDRGPLQLNDNDVAATCMLLEQCPGSGVQEGRQEPAKHLLDPDGHHLIVVDDTA